MYSTLPYLAISMGLLSSFHCIAMCGPIALSLPVHKGNIWHQNSGLLIYNTGRAATYSILGLLFGTVGSAITWIGHFRYLSIGAGLMILTYVFFSSQIDRHITLPKIWKKSIDSLKKNMARLLKSDNYIGWFGLGMLNGLLPCGMVYLALISSLATGTPIGSATYMLIFGLGTIPMMMAITSFRNLITPALRSAMRRFVPYAMAGIGLWLVVRGFIIEYPDLNTSQNHAITICRNIVSKMME